MNNPLVCPKCGGKRRAYNTPKRSLRFKTQYRRCDDCGTRSKTRKWIPQERQLTVNEIQSVPFLTEMVIDPQRFDVFLVVRPR